MSETHMQGFNNDWSSGMLSCLQLYFLFYLRGMGSGKILLASPTLSICGLPPSQLYCNWSLRIGLSPLILLSLVPGLEIVLLVKS